MPGLLASLRANPAARAALAIGAVATAAIAGAWTIEAMGYIPCELCYLGRKPYYLGIALAGLTLFAALRGRAGLARWGLAGLALVFAYPFLSFALLILFAAFLVLLVWAAKTLLVRLFGANNNLRAA